MSPGRVSQGVLQRGIGSKHKQMSQKVLKHFECCFTYALAQRKVIQRMSKLQCCQLLHISKETTRSV